MSSSISPNYRPMTRARYVRILSELRERFPWTAKHSLTVAPGHLEALMHMLTRLEEVLPPATLQAMDFFRVSTGAGSLSVNLNVGLDDQARRLALFSVIDECKRLAASRCLVCAASSTALKEGRCDKHQADTALYAEEFRQRKHKLNESPATDDLFRGATAGQQSCAVEASSTAEQHVEATALPRINFLDPADFTAFCNGIGGRPRDQQTRYEVVRNKVRQAGFATRKLGVLTTSWQRLADEFEATFPNFGEYAEVLRDHFALAARGDNRISLPPTLLVGPPGIGKTEAMSWLAERLGLPFELFDMACAQSGSALSGSDTFWSNTQPGRLFELLAYQEIANPIVMLDELDKVDHRERYNPLAGLYSLLEHHSAHKFIDLSIRDFAIDASHVNWVATANTLDSIPAPILSRFIVLQIPAPNEQQLRQIALNLYQRLRNENLWGASFAQELDENVTKSLTEQSPRYIRAALKRAFGAAARAGRDNITPEDSPIIKGSKHRGIGFLATFEEQGMTCTSDPP